MSSFSSPLLHDKVFLQLKKWRC